MDDNIGPEMVGTVPGLPAYGTLKDLMDRLQHDPTMEETLKRLLQGELTLGRRNPHWVVNAREVGFRDLIASLATRGIAITERAGKLLDSQGLRRICMGNLHVAGIASEELQRRYGSPIFANAIREAQILDYEVLPIEAGLSLRLKYRDKDFDSRPAIVVHSLGDPTDMLVLGRDNRLDAWPMRRNENFGLGNLFLFRACNRN